MHGPAFVVVVDDHLGEEQHATRTAARLSREKVERGGKPAVLKVRVTADHSHGDGAAARDEHGSEAPEGRVVVRVGERRIGSADLDERGRARIELPKRLPVGRRTLTTVFVPADDHWEGSAAEPVRLRVTR